MGHYLFAYALFLAAHIVPAVPRLRRRLIGLVGERVYLIVYSLISLGLLVWLISAAMAAPYVELWPQTGWARTLALYLAPVGLGLVIVGLVTPNPLSITLVGGGDQRPGTLTLFSRHPVLWGFALWAGIHIPVNGDLVFASLFAGFTLFALLGMIILDAKKKRQMGLQAWQSRTQSSPILGLPGSPGFGLFAVDRALAIGLLLAGLAVAFFLLGGHDWLFGVDPLA